MSDMRPAIRRVLWSAFTVGLVGLALTITAEVWRTAEFGVMGNAGVAMAALGGAFAISFLAAHTVISDINRAEGNRR